MSNPCVSWEFYEEYVLQTSKYKVVWNSEMNMKATTRRLLLHFKAKGMHVSLPAGKEEEFFHNAINSIVIT